jgi:hypothetical protein
MGADEMIASVSPSMSWDERIADMARKINQTGPFRVVILTSLSLYRE